MGAAIAAVSLTLSRTHITHHARDWTLERWPLLGQLFACPYCLSHWFALVLAPAVDMTLASNTVVNYLVTVFALIGVAAVWAGGIMQLMLHQESEMEHMRRLLVQAKERLRG